MTAISDQDRPVAADGLVIEQHGDGFHSVIAPVTASVLITNDTGRFVLESCDGSRSVAEIVVAVGNRFADASPELVRADVGTFLGTAARKEVVRW
ncbi:MULTISPECIES: PqqD family protein [Micromonospora]|uniref:PqqD family protein n=1 Tax=Micromonospora TaxID=1873 RepID=UPI003B3B8D21